MENARILIVEDEAIVAVDLENAIKEIGYDAIGRAVSAKDAINAATELEPDLILMDIVLNGKRTGIDASSQIRKTLDIPIIFLSINVEAYSNVLLTKSAFAVLPSSLVVFIPGEIIL